MTDLMNRLTGAGIPFIFVLDFDLKQPVILPLAEAASQGIFYDFNGMTNCAPTGRPLPEFQFRKFPVPYEKYRQAFNTVRENLLAGNSFLTNLTLPTPIETSLSLREIFEHSRARYKLLFKDRFVVFSPETFVTIEGNAIRSFPMKGTIDATLPDARQLLLNDHKERAEHFTIVDLIRNDLGRVADRVTVEKFRYLDRVRTPEKDLFQASSRIAGLLQPRFITQIGDLFAELLPAGSVTGAPKSKTVEIIRQAEQYDRGYYTGVFGYWDNGRADSAVMIRFIEQTPEGLVYKSGGGITVYSDPEKEFQELIDKVYIPIVAGSGQSARMRPGAGSQGSKPLNFSN